MINKNWKKESDYGFTKELTKKQWAWEFLRRNTEYQDKYQEFISKPKAHPLKNKTFFNLQEKLKPYTYLSRKYANEWSLKYMYDPNKDFSQGVRFKSPSGLPTIITTQDDIEQYFEVETIYDPEDRPAGDVIKTKNDIGLVAFDLRMPIGPQVNLCNKKLTKRKKYMAKYGHIKSKKIKTHPELWVRHLRVLDALLSGASSSDIAHGVKYYDKLKDEDGHNAASQANDLIKAAKRMSQKGYMDLL